MHPLQKLFDRHIYTVWILRDYFTSYSYPIELIQIITYFCWKVLSWSINYTPGYIGLVVDGEAYMFRTNTGQNAVNHVIDGAFTSVWSTDAQAAVNTNSTQFIITKQGSVYTRNNNNARDQLELDENHDNQSSIFRELEIFRYKPIKKISCSSYNTYFLTKS